MPTRSPPPHSPPPRPPPPPSTHTPRTSRTQLTNTRTNADGSVSGLLQVDPIDFGTTWGTVCSNGFDDKDADVACSAAGYAYHGRVLLGAAAAPFRVGTTPLTRVWLDDPGCLGTEHNLADCRDRTRVWGVAVCDHSQDVVLTCYRAGE